MSLPTLSFSRQNLLRWVAQFYPPQKMQLTLQVDSQFCPDECADADTVEVAVPFPSLLFLAIGDNAYLWAMKRRSFDPQSKLYHVPLPNVDSQGLLCFGANSKPEASVETVRQIWETWWSGIFNRDNVSGKSKAHPIDIREHLWAQRDQKGYPSKDLVKCDQDAGSAIERLIRQ
jgi:hypothetical protein